MQSMSRLEQKLYFQLEAIDTFVVTVADMARLLGISEAYARQVAHRLVKKGVFEQIKPGLYARIPASILIDKGQYSTDPILIASKLVEPYFLSFYTALSLHGLAQRPLQTIYLTSVKLVRSFRYRDFHFQPVKVIRARFFGYERIEYQGEKVWVSDVERTVLDALSRPELCGGWGEVIISLGDLQGLSWDKLLNYIDRFHATVLVHRLGYLLSHLHTLLVPSPFLEALSLRKSPSIFYLHNGRKGKLCHAWNLVVPPELEREFAHVG
jgi:predicted transcriptional regulator of viral defense system